MSSFNSLILSAPAKVILHGEHAVVYGKVALAASLGLRTTLSWEKCCENIVELHLNDLGFFSSWTIPQLESLPSFPKGDFKDTEAASTKNVCALKVFLQDNKKDISDIAFTATLAFLYLYKAIYGKAGRLCPGKFVVKSDIPVGAGLGSSASYSVVITAGILITAGAISTLSISKSTTESCLSEKCIARTDCLNLINKWSFEGEKLIHGNPSGIDNTMSTFGGFLEFQSGKMESLERVPELNILLINTNIPRSTKAMVGGLKTRYEQMPGVYEPLFTAMGAMTMECKQILGQLSKDGQSQATSSGADERKYRFQKLEKLIDLNQELLRIVGVSHPTVDEVCKKTLEFGLHSKLTGAGGGGCVVTLMSEAVKSTTVKELFKELKNLGCDCWKTKLGGRGVFLHEWS